MKSESTFPYESTFGIVIMLAGAFVAASGITDANFAYTAIGFVLFGFAGYLWIESVGVRISNAIASDDSDDESDNEE